MQKKEKPVTELLLEVGESAIDLVTDNDAVRDIPVVGWAFKVARALDDIRSNLLARKIAKFMSDPSLLAAVNAQEESSRIHLNNEHANEVGETLLMVLDKVTDFSKPALLAKAYASYLDGIIDKELLLMLAHIIDISSKIDLQHFIERGRNTSTNSGAWEERLVHTGLFELDYASVTYGGAAATSITPLGKALYRVLDHCESRCPS